MTLTAVSNLKIRGIQNFVKVNNDGNYRMVCKFKMYVHLTAARFIFRKCFINNSVINTKANRIERIEVDEHPLKVSGVSLSFILCSKVYTKTLCLW